MAWRDGTRHQIAPDASAIAWRSMRHPALTASCRPQNFMDNNPRAIEIISQFQQSQAPAGGGVSSSVRPAAAGPGPASYAATTGGPAQQQAPPQNLTPYRKPAQEELELSPVSSKTGKGRSQPGSRAASPQASAPPPPPSRGHYHSQPALSLGPQRHARHQCMHHWLAALTVAWCVGQAAGTQAAMSAPPAVCACSFPHLPRPGPPQHGSRRRQRWLCLRRAAASRGGRRPLPTPSRYSRTQGSG